MHHNGAPFKVEKFLHFAYHVGPHLMFARINRKHSVAVVGARIVEKYRNQLVDPAGGSATEKFMVLEKLVQRQNDNTLDAINHCQCGQQHNIFQKLVERVEAPRIWS